MALNNAFFHYSSVVLVTEGIDMQLEIDSTFAAFGFSYSSAQILLTQSPSNHGGTSPT